MKDHGETSIYTARRGQFSYGETIGILLLDSFAPFIPGDVANAWTYDYPVRFKPVPGLTVQRIFNHDTSIIDSVLEKALELEQEGVRAITGDCGFMALYQDKLVKSLSLPVFMSSLLQIPFLQQLINGEEKIGIITANSQSLNTNLLTSCGVKDSSNLVIRGLEDSPNFAATFINEHGVLDIQKVEAEVVMKAREMAEEDHVSLILFECSVLAPYGPAVQRATGLPIFDFISMIDFVQSAVVKKNFHGSM